MSGFECTIDAEGLFEALQKTPEAVASEIKKELRPALLEIRDYARANHRFHNSHTKTSGNAEKSIEFKVDPDGMGGSVFINTGIAPYAVFQHEGAGPHVIKPKNKKWLFWVSGGDKYFSKGVNHPGIKPDHFIVNAAEAKKDSFAERITRGIVNAFRAAGLS